RLFFDEGFRPHPGGQLVLADDIARAVRESDQDVERPAAQPKRPVVLEQRPLRRQEAKRSKRDRLNHSSNPALSFHAAILRASTRQRHGHRRTCRTLSATVVGWVEAPRWPDASRRRGGNARKRGPGVARSDGSESALWNPQQMTKCYFDPIRDRSSK